MAKHKYIESPDIMLELFNDYVKEVKSSPRLKHVFVGKDGNSENEKLECPLSMEGFECYVVENTKMTCPDLTEYFEGKNESYKEYFPICSYIRKKIRKDQIEGGMVGQYNASITQRLNGLKDSSDATVTVVEQPLFTKPKDV